MPRYTRRRLVVGGASAATIGSLAGCPSRITGSSGTDGDGPNARSSSLVFGDVASEVAGDTTNHDLRYVRVDPLESRRATQLVEGTDAEGVPPQTPIPGRTRTWADEDWCYVEVTGNVDLGTPEQALDAA